MQLLSLLLPLAATAAAAIASPASWTLPMKTSQLTAAEREAIFQAAGFSRNGDGWVTCDGNGEGLLDDEWVEGGAIRDLNGDGRAEVIVVDTGTACHGMTGQGYTLLTPTADGWKLVDARSGIPRFLSSKGAGGWPDVEVGGPGFCFPVLRWDGQGYELLRQQYEGKPCRR